MENKITSDFEARMNQEYFNCPKCGKKLSKHKFFFNGCRIHVESYHGVLQPNGTTKCETRCSEKDCELNHKCGEDDE